MVFRTALIAVAEHQLIKAIALAYCDNRTVIWNDMLIRLTNNTQSVIKAIILASYLYAEPLTRIRYSATVVYTL